MNPETIGAVAAVVIPLVVLIFRSGKLIGRLDEAIRAIKEHAAKDEKLFEGIAQTEKVTEKRLATIEGFLMSNLKQIASGNSEGG